ncbi:MAG TPA: PaaI family thioesterase [Syntrophales bacterium]|nr:PaaI family thioesterase [Syntrophales bacterium]
MKINFSWTNMKIVQSKINKSPFYRTISMKVEMANKKGSIVRIKSGYKHKNLWGTVHGGTIASLVDSTCGLSVFPYLKDGETMVTISLYMDYIAPVIEGDILGQGRIIHRGRRLVRAEAIIRDQTERIVAKGYASFMILENNTKLPGDS